MNPLLELRTICKRFGRGNGKTNTSWAPTDTSWAPTDTFWASTDTFWAPTDSSAVIAVDHVDLDIGIGETFGLVGESGSGKTTLARIAAGLVRPDKGQVLFDGLSVTGMSLRVLQSSVWTRAQLVFQDVSGALNPRLTVGETLADAVRFGRGSGKGSEELSRELLREVELDGGRDDSYLDRFPHELSTGEKQRVGLARALAVKPELIILDEPVSALDVTVRRRIIGLLLKLKKRYNLTLFIVTHDFEVLEIMAHRAGVMQAGRLVECASMEDILNNPLHPYTTGLVRTHQRLESAIRAHGAGSASGSPDRKESSGHLVEKKTPLVGTNCCLFADACPRSRNTCFHERPLLEKITGSHQVACHYAGKSQ